MTRAELMATAFKAAIARNAAVLGNAVRVEDEVEMLAFCDIACSLLDAYFQNFPARPASPVDEFV